MVLVLAFVGAAAHGAVRDLVVTTPRSFGYVIGDEFTHKVRLVVDKPFRLQDDSLPRAGKLNNWLEMRPIVVRAKKQENARVYEIELTYQIMTGPKRVRTLVIPDRVLTVSDGTQSLPVFVRGWSFTVAPLTAYDAEASAQFVDLQPEHRPILRPLTPHLWCLAMLFCGVLVAFIYLLYAYGAIPFVARSKGPFARAYRQLKSLKHRPFSEHVYRQALCCVHSAFNETAGGAVFKATLPNYFSSHPGYQRLRVPIERLFDESQDIFFAAGETVARRPRSLQAMMQLCLACRDIERGLR